MDIASITRRFTANAHAIESLIRSAGPEQIKWRPGPGKWSILEVAAHLCDEEVFDFRTRVDMTLHNPDAPWPKINPQGWVTERAYNEQNPAEVLSRYLDEREQSITFLSEITNPDWTLSYDHPELGRLTAGDLLASWLDHDYLHIRQLSMLHHAWLVREVDPHSVKYAGGV